MIWPNWIAKGAWMHGFAPSDQDHCKNQATYNDYSLPKATGTHQASPRSGD